MCLRTQGLQLQAHIVELGRAFVDGVRQLKLSEEEVEQIWMDAMSPAGQKLFSAHMDEVRAKVKDLRDSVKILLISLSLRLHYEVLEIT